MDNCARCGKPREGGSSGSLTQWMAVCSCDLTPLEDEQAASLHICQTCGKRISSGRAGSLTQWVFRQEVCRCSAPMDRRPRATSEELSQELSGRLEAPDVEIEVDRNVFPYERYIPLGRLGQGGTGEVYLCRDRLLGKKVAVKTLRVVTAEQLMAFQLEAKATSALSHQNIVTILDFGATESGAPYMVLEFVKGESLENVLARQKTLPWQSVLQLIIQLSSALSYAHSMKIFHRDLKPSNILLIGGDSEILDVRLIDFGVARMKEVQTPAAIQGSTLVGTPAYMSPDQMAGREYDARSEVYSLGCVMFQCLSGRVPFEGETAQATLAMHATQAPPKLSSLPGAQLVPPFVESILYKCLSKDPADRFNTMEELSNRVRVLLNEEMKTATFIVKKEKPVSWMPVALVVIGLAVTAALLAGVLHQEPSKPKNATRVKAKFIETKLPDSRVLDAIWYTTDVKVTDDDFKELSSKSVERLNLTDQQITGSGLQYLKPELIELRLNHTAVSDESIKFVNDFPTLSTLSLEATTISKAGLEKLTNLNKLERLSLGFCANIDDDAVKFVAKRWPNLIQLRIGDTKCTPKVFPVILTFNSLREFEMSSMSATPEEWSVLLRDKSFTDLKLMASNISSKNIPDLCRMKSLKGIYLEACREITEKDIVTLTKSLPRCTIRSSSTTPEKLDQYDGLFEGLGK